MAKYYVERLTGVTAYELPSVKCREIGRIITRWAYFEHAVQEMIWGALGLSQEMGRVAVREPRVTDRLEMLADIIRLREGNIDSDLYKSIQERATLLLSKRDLLAHGKWFHNKPTGEWFVALTKGSWPKDKRDLIPEKSKRVFPESVAITVAILKTTTSEIDLLVEDLKRLRDSAVAPPRS